MSARIRKLRLGLAGLGTASVDILREVVKHPNFEIVAGCDTRPEARAAFAGQMGGRTFDSVDEMAADTGVDAVYVATPNYLHCEHVLAAIRYGKDVIVEKPIAMSLAECDRIIEAAAANGTRVLAGHTHSFDAPIEAMVEAIGRGDIGDVYMINQWFFTDWLYRGRMAEELDETRGGGVVFRQGPHAVDIVRALAGQPLRRVRAQVTALDDMHPGTPASFLAFLEFDSIIASLAFSGYAYFDTAELGDYLGEDGLHRPATTHAWRRHRIRSLGTVAAEADYKNSMRMGGGQEGSWMLIDGQLDVPPKHPYYGINIVSGSLGDMRQTPDGIVIYGNDGPREVVVPRKALEREAELSVLYNAWIESQPLASHDAVWARGTLEACLAIRASSLSGEAVTIGSAELTSWSIGASSTASAG